MVSQDDFDDLLSRLQRFGETGRGGRMDPQEQVNEEHARQISVLTKTVQALLRHSRQGPDWEKVYRVPDTGTAADYPWSGTGGDHYTLYHDLDFTPRMFAVVRRTAAKGQYANIAELGSIRMISADKNKCVFQFDRAAENGATAFWVVLFRDEFMPLEVQT